MRTQDNSSHIVVAGAGAGEAEASLPAPRRASVCQWPTAHNLWVATGSRHPCCCCTHPHPHRYAHGNSTATGPGAHPHTLHNSTEGRSRSEPAWLACTHTCDASPRPACSCRACKVGPPHLPACLHLRVAAARPATTNIHVHMKRQGASQPPNAQGLLKSEACPPNTSWWHQGWVGRFRPVRHAAPHRPLRQAQPQNCGRLVVVVVVVVVGSVKTLFFGDK